MYQLGLGAGAPIVLALIGVAFDLFKIYAPTLIAKVFNRSHITTLLLMVLSVSLMAISATASIFSLNHGIDALLSQSQSAKIAEQTTVNLRQEILGLNQLRDSQLSIHYVTPAAHTTELIDQKNEQLNKALIDSKDSGSNNVLSQYRNEILYIVSIGLELISVAMTLTLFHLQCENKGQNNQKRDETVSVSNLVSSSLAVGVEGKLKPFETDGAIPEAAFVAATTREQVLENMRVALLSGSVEPKYRSIWDSFKDCIKQREIKVYLEELAERNILKRQNNGSYQLV